MKVDDTKENMERCICMSCPTYDECMKGKSEGFFCAWGKSGCGFKKLGCICGECPLSGEYMLNKMYYCSIGASE
ncbi:MAG: DUF2769 domain-containing protein [Actinomycetota bacterium]|nr:DUF2769 domain-containing protein [Actinomycetota bacterium]